MSLALKGAETALIFFKIYSELLYVSPCAGLNTFSSTCFYFAAHTICASFMFEEKVSLSAGIGSLGIELLD